MLDRRGIFKNTYAYDKFLRNGSDLEKTIEEYKHDIVLDSLMVIDLIEDIPRTKKAAEKFISTAGMYMPNNGSTFDGGLSLLYYVLSYTVETLFYNFCDFLYMCEMGEKDNLKEELLAYADRTAKEVYESIEKKSFVFNEGTITKMRAVLNVLFSKHAFDEPYQKGDGYNLSRRGAFLKEAFDALDCPYYDEVWETAKSAV